MFKSTLFIALQCCNCSNMQVKQQKKSSNKWNCVVCNQKQSVIKIHAQGYQAKDIRQFVQSFNMSRKVLADEEQAALQYDGHFVEHLEGSQADKEENNPKRRTDWGQYLEDEEDCDPAYLKSLPDAEQMFEPKIVTETPEVLFKKAKAKSNFGSSSSTGLSNSQKYKPKFLKREAIKKSCKPQDEVARNEANDNSYSSPNLKRRWQQEEQEQKNKMTVGKKSASKWNVYIVEDEHDSTYQGETACFDQDLKITCGDNDMEPEGKSEMVEEDIHPDFF